MVKTPWVMIETFTFSSIPKNSKYEKYFSLFHKDL